jgi:hypothetical protein
LGPPSTFHQSTSILTRSVSLAYAELYLALARIMSSFDMDLFETTAETDVRLDRDLFVGVPKATSKGVRAKIVGLRTEF